MKRLAMVLILALAACGRSAAGGGVAAQDPTLTEARRGAPSHASIYDTRDGPAAKPPAHVLQLVKYPAPLGAMAAYLTPDPHDGAKHPAIIWITGGDSASIGDVWSPAPADNDQSARAFRQAGIVTMYPSLRGGNDNPGHREGFFGEVNDILAAADYLARQPYVDPRRIYLGGHSTGGTLVLLVAETSPRFRDTFAFGPVADVQQYGGRFLPANPMSDEDTRLRSPAYWLGSIGSPVFVLEGADKPSNAAVFDDFRRRAEGHPLIHFQVIPGATHFSDLAPATAMLARKILADTGPSTNISISDAELAGLMGAH